MGQSENDFKWCVSQIYLMWPLGYTVILMIDKLI